MPRRVSLPGASELFRAADSGENEIAPIAPPQPVASPRSRATTPGPTRSTGRVRHDEKITVYVSREELLALEQARLLLRAEHGIAVDRGRIVRAAVAAALQQLEDEGADSDLVTRLSDS